MTLAGFRASLLRDNVVFKDIASTRLTALEYRMGDFDFFLVDPFFRILVGCLSLSLAVAGSLSPPFVGPPSSLLDVFFVLEPPLLQYDQGNSSRDDPHALVSCICPIEMHSFLWAYG